MDERHYTRFMVALLRAYVARGAEWLDTQAPGWAEHLLGFLGMVEMQNPYQCIIGTLLRTHFLNGVAAACDSDGVDFWQYLRAKGLRTGATYGFNIPEDEDTGNFGQDFYAHIGEGWSVLMEAWVVEVMVRVTPETVAAALGRAEAQQIQLASVLRSAQDNKRRVESEIEAARARYNTASTAYETAQEQYETARSGSEDADSAIVDAESAARDNLACIQGLQDYVTRSAVAHVVTLD